MRSRRVVVGISGASGFQYGLRALELLRPLDHEVHLVVSKGAERTAALETDHSVDDAVRLADVVHAADDLGAAISSGSFPTLGMLVAPCSMRSLAAIAHGLSDTLLTRAADVTLKERRPLVLLARETPLNLAHIENMRSVTLMGGIVMPPVPALYARPRSVDEIVTRSVRRALTLLGIEGAEESPWIGGVEPGSGG